MELTKMELFKAMNDKHRNLRDCEGQIIRPVAHHTHTYQDSDGKTGEMLKTEVQAFIDKFLKYDEAFGAEPDDQKPEIIIVLNVSKKGNKYVNFDLVTTAE